jgi:hypothetical protein
MTDPAGQRPSDRSYSLNNGNLYLAVLIAALLVRTLCNGFKLKNGTSKRSDVCCTSNTDLDSQGQCVLVGMDLASISSATPAVSAGARHDGDPSVVEEGHYITSGKPSLLVPARPHRQNFTMFFSYLTIALTALLLPHVAAAPTPLSDGASLEKRAPVQIVRNCVNSGQVALTFDGKPHASQPVRD